MRLVQRRVALGRLALERYGPFERLELPLDPAPGRVNLIVAPNGYGKSVIRTAIGDMLFGIPERTPMDFRYGTERMRIQADIALDGSVWSLVRRKGRGNTLARADDGAPVSADDARHLLGDTDQTVFRELFGLDTALLRSGGQELIRSQGRLGQVMFAAGGGMGRVRDQLSALERQRDELGRAAVRHKARPLWNALSAWEQATVDLRLAALRPDGWATLEREATDASRRLDALLAEQEACGFERDRLRGLGAVRPWLDRLQAARRTLADAGDAPDLDDQFERRWREALEAGSRSASLAEAAAVALSAAEAARASMTSDAAWIEAGEEIERLAGLRGPAIAAAADLPAAQAALAEVQEQCMRLRRDLGWDAALAPPAASAMAEAQRHLGEHPVLAAEAGSAERAQAEAERRWVGTQAEIDGLADPADVAALSDLSGLLRAGGDPAARLEAARRQSRAAGAALAAALADIPDRLLPEAGLGTTVAPSEARLNTAERMLARAEAAHGQAVQEVLARGAEADALRTELAALERTARLPPPDALEAARTRRDSLWAALCESAPLRPDPLAAVALDRAMREADAVADALIAHGREVAAVAALRDRLALLDPARAGSEAAIAGAVLEERAARLAEARAGLAAIAVAAGGEAQDMPALRAFLRARSEAVACLGERDRAAAELADLVGHLDRLGGQLAEALGTAPRPMEASAALLAEADRRIAAAHTLSARRETLGELAAAQRRSLAAAITDAATARQALADWQAQWDDILRTMNRPIDEVPAATAGALSRIEALRLAEAGRDAAGQRIAGMQRAVALLAGQVAGVIRLSRELAALPAAEAADALLRRLASERREAARCEDADRHLAEARRGYSDSLASAGEAARALAGLRAALRVTTDAAAELQLQRGRAAASARRDLAEALRELAAQGGGLAVDTLAARAAETTAEQDTARIRVLATQHADLAIAVDAAREARKAAVAALDRAGTGVDAADAAQRREASQAALGRLTEEALVLHAAHSLLHAALDRHAAGADQPLLTRIGQVFSAITGGAYAGVAIEDTRAGQAMVALEADGITRKPLDQLSEGSSDQLYLALRIAALESYASAALSLPFIADDVLQTFDDARTTATLHALLGLSEQVQVIALTHHPHVGDLAALLPAGTVHLLRLGA